VLAEELEELEPEVVLLEVASPDEPLVLGEPDTRPAFVVLADAVSDDSWVADALARGVLALLPRDAGAREILAAVDAAAAGLVTLHPSAMEALRAGRAEVRSSLDTPPLVGSRASATVGGELTPRETEVLRMLAEGLSNKQIASRLAISEHTVKFHVASVYEKLGATSRTEAVRLGVRRGLIVL
jgi:DNA-binding NarL/FixJ family response regulator